MILVWTKNQIGIRTDKESSIKHDVDQAYI